MDLFGLVFGNVWSVTCPLFVTHPHGIPEASWSLVCGTPSVVLELKGLAHAEAPNYVKTLINRDSGIHTNSDLRNKKLRQALIAGKTC